MKIRKKTRRIVNLGDGPTLLYKTTKRKASAWYMGFLGGAMEDEKEGTAHFLEHMLFNGTNKRTCEDINKDEIEIASLNAYTGAYYTILESVRTNKLTNETLEFMTDILLNNKINEDKMENERKVIIEEFNKTLDKYKINVGYHNLSQIFECSFNYPKILGTLEDIESINKNDLEEFKKKNYVKQNFILSVVTKMPVKKVIKLYKEIIEPKLFYANDYQPRKVYDIEPSKPESLVIVKNENLQQVSCMISLVYNKGVKDCENRNIFDYIRVLIGGQNSSLFTRLRKMGLIYSFGSCSFTEYNHKSVCSFDFKCLPEKIKQIIDVIGEEFKTLYENGMSQEFFEKEHKNQEYLNDELPSSYNMLRIAKGMILDYVELEYLPKKLNWKNEHKKITLNQINRYLKTILSRDNKLYVTYLGNVKDEDVYSLEETKSKLLF